MISAFSTGRQARHRAPGSRGIAGALAAGMNAVTFATKRAFQGFVRVTRKQMVELGLTAARFDLLSTLVEAGRANGAVRQSEIRRMLGVTAPVVTRMLRALQALGLVRRWRDYLDRRQVRVALTEEGEQCILRARKVMLPAVKKMVYRAICFGRHRSADARLIHMDTLEGYLRGLREMFGDRARLYYPWGHPDD
jgi:DNA-binding MarR family transcriptional regulator